jgi:nucleotide-binding universal stress UspA family protein
MSQEVFKTIIVGVDFSDYSKLVVKQAQYLCKIWNTNLVLVHAMQDPVSYMSEAYISFPNILTPEFYEKRIRDTYKVKNNSATIIADRDIASELLINIASRYPLSLVMVGYKGQSSMSEFFFGSTAQTLALKAKVPVWIQRGDKVIQPKRILIPHDLTLKANASIDIVKKLSLALPSSYEVFHVQKKIFPVLDYKKNMLAEQTAFNKMRTQIESTLKSYPEVPVITRQGKITEKVVKRTNKFDLLVMTHHNPTGLFTKSETITLLKKVKTPILITH